MNTLSWIEYLIQSVFYGTAACLQILLYCHLRNVHKQNRVLKLNVVYWICIDVLGSIYASYLVIIGNKEGYRSGLLIFYSGTFTFAFLISLSLSVSFLMIDRILVFNSHVNYTVHQRQFFFLSIGCTLAGGLFCAGFYLYYELPIPVETTCTSFNCMLRKAPEKILSPIKLTIGVGNIVLASVFWRKYTQHRQHYTGTHRNQRQGHVVTALAITTELTLNLVPATLWFIFGLIGVKQIELFGPYLLTFHSADSLITSMVYSIVLLQKQRRSSTAVSPVPRVSRDLVIPSISVAQY